MVLLYRMLLLLHVLFVFTVLILLTSLLKRTFLRCCKLVAKGRKLILKCLCNFNDLQIRKCFTYEKYKSAQISASSISVNQKHCDCVCAIFKRLVLLQRITVMSVSTEECLRCNYIQRQQQHEGYIDLATNSGLRGDWISAAVLSVSQLAS